MLRQLLTGVLALAACTIPLPGAAPVPAADRVDTTLVLRVGPVAISAYAYAKNERLYREQIRQTHGREPTAAELAGWRALFRAQQALLADAHARGYFSRPDLLDVTRQMEEYMLTQPEGPFYASLYPTVPDSDERLRPLHELNRRVLDVESAWFDSAAEADRALGADFPRQPAEEKLRRLRTVRDNPHVRYFVGRMTWPCAPFPTLAGEILALGAGQWLGPAPSLDGVLQLYVRDVHDQAIPEFAPRRESIAEFVREFDRECVRQRRRAEIFRHARLEWDATLAARVIACLAPGVDATGHLGGAALDGLGERPLARYQWDDAPVVVKVGDWQAWFNRQLARRVPQSAADIGESLHALVQTRYDLRDALHAGAASRPRFVEDRANFLRNQVLAAYERDLLAPDEPVSEEDIARYYAANRARFERVSRVSVRRLEFASEAAAAYYVTHATPANALPDAALLREEWMELGLPSRDDATSARTRLLFAAPVGFVHGPERTAQGTVVVFVRGPDLARSVVPLGEVHPLIRREIERAALDRRTVQRAQEIAPAFSAASVSGATATAAATLVP